MWHVWGKQAVHTRFGGGRPDRRRQPARPRYRWEDNIKVNLQEIKLGGSWVDLAQD